MTSDTDTGSYLDDLRAALRPIEWRLRLRDAAVLAPVSGALGLAVALALALVSRFWGGITPLGAVLGGMVSLSIALVATTSYALFRRRNSLHTARSADALLGLEERLATAWEWAERGHDISLTDKSSLTEMQRQDALRRALEVDPSRALPVKVEARRLLPAGLAALLIAVVLLAPSFEVRDPQAEAVAAQIAQEADKVDQFAERIEGDPRLAQDPKLEELLAELGDLSRDLREGALTREEALARLSQSEGELEKVLEPEARGEREAIEKLAKQLIESESAAAKEVGLAMQAGDTRKAAEAMDRLAAEATAASPQERERLAQRLREARDSVASFDPETARRLNEAAEALTGDDTESAERALEELGKRTDDVMERASTQENVRQALAQIQSGKENIADAGRPTPVTAASTPPAGAQSGTAGPQGSAAAGTPAQGGTPGAVGTPGDPASQGGGTPAPESAGTPLAANTPGGQGAAEGGQGQDSNGQQNGGNSEGGQGGLDGWGKADQEPVSVPPKQVNAQGTPVRVGGENNPDGEGSVISTGTDVNNTGPAQVPYSEVYGEYRERAGKALDGDYIPQGYKDLVREYFSEIEPK